MAAVACLEFHRQCYQLEHHHQRKGQNSDLYQRLCREEQTRKDQRNGQPGAEIGDGNNGIAEGKRGIIRCMLDGMAHLMGGNTDGSNGSGSIHRIRKPYHIGTGIVMVGEAPATRWTCASYRPFSSRILRATWAAVMPRWLYTRLYRLKVLLTRPVPEAQ